MKCTLEGDYLYIESEEELHAPFLGRSKGGVYKIYWHFIRDVAEKYDPDLSEEFLNKLRDKVTERDKALEIIEDEDYIINQEYETYLDDDYKPYNFQARGAGFIVQQKRVLVADDVGLGKSVETIIAILDLLWKGLGSKFIIIVPASLRLQWLSELRKFVNRKMFEDLRFILIRAGEVGSKKNRMRLYKEFNEEIKPTIMIMSYATMVRDKKKLEELEPDMVILDEAQKIKNRTTKTNEAVRKLFSNVEYKVALTATPVENGLQDLYSIAEWLDKKRLRTKSYMLHRYCEMDVQRIWQGRGKWVDIQKVVGYKNTEDMKQKLSGLYIRRTVQDVALELPKIIHSNITLEMDKDQIEVYKEIKGEIYGDLSKIDLIAQLTLLQECCNAIETLDRQGRGGAKLREFTRLITEDFRYQKVIAITRFKKYADFIYDRLKNGKKNFNLGLITGDTSQDNRALIIDNFMGSDEQEILIGTEAIQTGLNLQGGSILINFDLPYTVSSLWQRLGRLNRIGSEHDIIRMVNLIMNDTMEERILEILYEKGELFQRMFDVADDVKIGNLLDMDSETIRGMI